MKLLLLFLVLLPACGISQTTDWKVLNHTDYSIKYPPNWELSDKEEMGVKFFLFSELESQDDVFRENINLVIEDLTGYNVDLDEYSRLSEINLKKAMANVKILENKKITTGSGPHRALIYEADHSDYKLQFLAHFWVTKTKAYVLTFTAAQSSFGKFKSTATEVFDSFVIKK